MVISKPLYVGLEELKEYLGISSATKNDRMIILTSAISRFIENYTGRKFYPKTETKKYDWQDSFFLEVDDLLSVISLKDNRGDRTIDNSYLFFEPVNSPPYSRIIIDYTKGYFSYDGFREQAIQVDGVWGYCDNRLDTGITSPRLTEDDKEMDINDGSKLDVGWLTLIEDERIFISDISSIDSTVNTSSALDDYQTNIPVDTPSLIKVGEIIRINDENMKVLRIDSSSLNVIRGYEGTTPMSHNIAQDVYVYRKLTIERGMFGSTASIHPLGKVIYRLSPPSDIIYATGVLVARANKRSDSGWSDFTTLGGEGQGTIMYSRIMPSEVNSILEGYVRRYISSI